MTLETPAAPHVAPARSVATVMALVIAATLPAAVVHIVVFGPGLIVHALLAGAACALTEALCQRARGRDAGQAVTDWSAVLCGVLLAFCLPPLAPWYLSVVGSIFAIAVAKHAFGGLGANVFNPAMAGYAFLILSFPEAMTRWPAADGPGPWASLGLIFTGADTAWDTLTMATPLDQLRDELGQMKMLSEIVSADAMPSRGGWWAFQGAALAGGLFLLALKVIRWQLPVATLVGALVCAGLLHIVDPDRFATAAFHLGAGSVVFAAFFIVTDPVTAATSPRGRLMYGACIGALAILIRTFGAYPDGMAFAVLLMNALVPLIDRMTRPRVYGDNAPPPEDTL
ncbi:MAG: RnfABCDGE type electron transport complex subunit D [Pseudomonadota bacterium]